MTFHKVRLGVALVGLAGAASALLPAGCSGSVVEDICDAMCDCTGCSDAEYLDCVDSAEASQKAAEDGDCTSKFDTYTACVSEELECGEDEVVAYDGCEDEESALRECGVSLFRSVCEIAQDFTANECGFGGTVDPNVDCSGQLECQSKCIVATTCEGLTGSDQVESNKFFECVNACGFTQED